MARHIMRLFAVLLASAVSYTDCRAGDDASAEKKVKEFLDAKMAQGYKITRLDDAFLQRTFPNHPIYSALFRQYPVARALPEGLRAQNLFVVTDDPLAPIQDVKQLEKMFKTAAPSAKKDDVALAALKLVEELQQDGFYTFKTVDEATKSEGGKASAKAVVSAGGNGEISVQVAFDAAGKVTGLTASVMLKPGPRPICQATKLLDPDPLVRRICEQDLMIMGRTAVEYLDEQAAKAEPPLRTEIERVRQAILAADE